MNTKYSYKILREEVETEDFFQEKTHENIKNSLLDLIKNETEGITIGLSGQWGSGKSTIINLLKNDSSIKDIFSFFYFDAWAHEGDPLRRIFLESLINSLKENETDENIIKLLEEKRKIISREKKTKHTTIKRSTTLLGLMLTIATLFFTIGIAVLSSINYDNLNLKTENPLHWTFITSISLVSLPFLILIWNLIYLLKNDKEISDLNNWSFLQNNSDETIIEDVIGDDERSSIEFEKYFKEILEIYNTQKERKVIIVLDNLDRVDAEVSLRIWSTLQTFIQHKNPTSKDYKVFKNIFTIIPYDEVSLMKIWENYTENNDGTKKIDSKFSSSFFDKSFQVRIDVPKPIISNWLDFIRNMVEKSFYNWDKKDKDVIVEVIEKTRKDILDNPKPREIKTYLNQIGFLRNHIPTQISTKNIAFYTYMRYLQGYSNDKIADYLIDKSKILKEEINLFDDNTIKEFASIIYGVSKEQGEQILITPKILEALNKDKPELLKDLISNFNTVFWSIFKNRITNTNKLRDYLTYSTPINKCFDSYNEDINNIFIPSLSSYLGKEIEFNYVFDDSLTRDIKNTSDLFRKYSKEESIKQIWSFLINVYQYQENKNETNDVLNDERNTIFINTLHHIFETSKLDFKIQGLNIKFENWREINKHSDFSKISIFLKPSEKFITETSNYIRQGSNIEIIAYSLIDNFILHKSLNLEPILLNLRKHFVWNSGNQSGNIFNFRSIELLENLYYNYKNYDFSEFLKTPEIYTICYSTLSENEKGINIIATLCAVHFKEKVIQLQNEVPQINSSANHITLNITNYWKTSSIVNAKYSYEILKNNNLLKIVWELCTNNENALCCNIIELMITNNENSEFNLINPFEILSKINVIEIDNFEISNIINKFFECSELEKNILEIDDLDITTNDNLIFEILKLNNSDEVFEKVEKELKKIEKDSLIKSLSEIDFLFDILLKVKEHNIIFNLDKLNDVLYEFVYGSFLKNNLVFIFQKWHVENWSKIVKLLDIPHYDNFSKRITNLIMSEKENLKDEFFELNKEFINKQFLSDLINKENDSFQLYIQEALQNSTNIDKLIFIEKIFILEEGKKIKFDKNFKEIIKDNVLSLKAEGSSEELIRISTIIANRLSIK